MHHTRQELARIAKETGLELAGTIDTGQGHVPLFRKPGSHHVDDLQGFRPIGGHIDNTGAIQKPLETEVETVKPRRRAERGEVSNTVVVEQPKPVELPPASGVFKRGDPKPLRANYADRAAHIADLRAWTAAQQS